MSKEVKLEFKDLREAVIAFNESGLLKEKIKLVGVNKEEILKEFMDTVQNMPDDADGKFPGPAKALEFYNSILDAEEKATKEKKAPTVEETKPEVEVPETKKETPVPVEGPKPVVNKIKNSGKKDFISSLIAEGKYTKKEIVSQTMAEFPEGKDASIVTIITDGKNPKYNPFKSLVKVDEKGIVSFVS